MGMLDKWNKSAPIPTGNDGEEGNGEVIYTPPIQKTVENASSKPQGFAVSMVRKIHDLMLRGAKLSPTSNPVVAELVYTVEAEDTGEGITFLYRFTITESGMLRQQTGPIHKVKTLKLQ